MTFFVYFRPHTPLEDILSVQLLLSMLFWRWNHLFIDRKLYDSDFLRSRSILYFALFSCYIFPSRDWHLWLKKIKNKNQALLLALHKLKVSEEQRKSAIGTHEPLVAFALSCGMYSSPAVIPTVSLYFVKYFFFYPVCSLSWMVALNVHVVVNFKCR